MKAVAIRGAGKDFCAGADLDELLASADKSAAENEAAALRLGALFLRMRALPKPIVALVHGRALAGGAGLATGCDMIFAAESARFGYPEIQRGFVPAMVMTMLRRVVGEKVAFDLAATGRVLTALEASRLGLISRVFPDADFETSGRAALTDLAALSPSALALTKRQFYQLDGTSFEDGVRLGAKVNAVARATPEFRAGDCPVPEEVSGEKCAGRREMPGAVQRVKEVAYLVGMILAVTGIALDNRPMVWVAIGILAAGVILRLVLARRQRQAEDDLDG